MLTLFFSDVVCGRASAFQFSLFSARYCGFIHGTLPDYNDALKRRRGHVGKRESIAERRDYVARFRGKVGATRIKVGTLDPSDSMD